MSGEGACVLKSSDLLADADAELAAVPQRGEASPGEAPREEGAKRRQILDGARRVFLDDGFDGASMNEVARAAGVSKGTLYVYFASKEELFAALLRDEKRGQAEQLCGFTDDDLDLRSTLHGFGVRFIELMLRPDSLAHLRTVMAVAPKFPEIGRAYYEAGPETGRRRIARYLDRQVADGRLTIADTLAASILFFELLKAGILLEALLSIGPRPTPADVERHVEQAVELFIKAHS